MLSVLCLEFAIIQKKNLSHQHAHMTFCLQHPLLYWTAVWGTAKAIFTMLSQSTCLVTTCKR